VTKAAEDGDWAFHADEAAVFAALAARRHTTSLAMYFGAESYRELAALAARPRPTPRPGPRILVLPGIMGSRLGGAPRPSRPAGVVWVDPQSIAAGGLADLALPEGRVLRPMGVLLFAYARLLLHLRLAGFDAAFHPYDWRLGLDELGAGLAARIREAGEPVALIGHSMGGLVARMALPQLPRRLVRKLIMVGTPNFGAYSPLMALRGSYPFVRKMTTLDPLHTPEELAAKVFHTFPGLYQLLPAGLPSRWPADGPAPDPALLRDIGAVRARLAPAEDRMVQILGVGRRTVEGVRSRAAGFEYRASLQGDGSVPVKLAALPRVRRYYVNELHARLVSNDRVIGALIDLLRLGRTTALSSRWRNRDASMERFDDAALRGADETKIDWNGLGPDERAALMADLNR
jgi:pimeloyl-ACP methyl ester carboxylesterase